MDFQDRRTLLPLMRPLQAYLNEEAAFWVAQLLVVHGVELRITKERSSKFADYRPPWKGRGHVISINHNLRPLTFLLIFLHEYAHLLTWVDYGNKVAPHGPEWADAYGRLVEGAVRRNYFPTALHAPLRKAMRNPQVSGCAQPELLAYLHGYEGMEAGWVALETLPAGKRFATKAGKLFEKGPKARTRFRCYSLSGSAWYLVPQSLMVRPLD